MATNATDKKEILKSVDIDDDSFRTRMIGVPNPL